MGSKEVVIQGCVFTEIHNGTAYELTRYTGNAPRLKIPAFLGDNKPVVRIGDYAFDGCSSITDIILLDGINEIGDYAFHNCTSLTNVKIPQGVLKKGRDIFAGCIKLHINDKNSQLTSSVSFSPKQVVIQGCVFTEINNGTAYELTRYTGNAPRLKIPASLGDNKPVVRIGDNAFDGCSSITDIILLDGITEIGNYAFRNCTALKNIQIPHSVSKRGKDIFFGCNNLPITSILSSQITSDNISGIVSFLQKMFASASRTFSSWTPKKKVAGILVGLLILVVVCNAFSNLGGSDGSGSSPPSYPEITIPTSKGSSSTGYVSITSSPSGASISLMGTSTITGTTPFRAEVPAGYYKVIISKTGYYLSTSVNSNIKVNAGKTTSASFTLTKAGGSKDGPKYS